MIGSAWLHDMPLATCRISKSRTHTTPLKLSYRNRPVAPKRSLPAVRSVVRQEMSSSLTAPACRELVDALRQRYAATREEKSQMLSEFASVSGLHRKSAIRVLNAEAEMLPAKRRGLPQVCDLAVEQR